MQRERLLATFLDLVRHDNPSGEEDAIVSYIGNILEGMGLKVEQDNSLNLLARLPGTGDPILLNAHTDSVQPCRNVQPVVEGGIIRSSGDTVLGADDLAGVAAILEAVRSIHESGRSHRAAEILFTSQEETGLCGANAFDYTHLRAREGITLDSPGEPGGICLGAPSQANLLAIINGRASHAGIAPEEGISAIRVAAEAIAAMPFGRIDKETTSNIGVIHGGEATNIVTPRVELRGEARSHSPQKLKAQIQAMVDALRTAGTRHRAQVEITVTYPYQAYRLDEDEPVVQQVMAAMRRMAIEPYTFIGGGGSDVNVFAQHGLRVANLSIGYQAIHSVEEHIAVADLEFAAQVVATLLEL